MTLKVVCYGVRPNEVPFFEKLNKYNFELRLVEELLTHDNINTAEGMLIDKILRKCQNMESSMHLLVQ